MEMLPQFTVTESEAVPDPSLVVVTEAELFTCPQVAGVVGEVMWTWVLALGARLAGPKDNTPLAIDQPELEPPASIDQFSPELVGRVSVTVTPLAVPVPVLVTV